MKFKAVLELNGKTATGIEVPAQVVDQLGSGKQPAVKVTLKQHTYRTTVAVRSGRFLIPVSAEHRAGAGIAAGDTVEVTIVLDTEPRTIEVSADFAAALAKRAKAKRAFDGLSNSHKKRHTLAIEGAKTDETRQRRIAKAIEMLEAGG